jgi:hypothetical protein
VRHFKFPARRSRCFNEEESHNYQFVVLQIDEGKTIVTRDQLVDILDAENVLARRYSDTDNKSLGHSDHAIPRNR